MTIHALTFDLDGTLCDTLPDLAAAANATRVASGLAPLPVPRIESYVGDGIPRLVHRLLLDAREGDAPAAQHAAAYQYFTDYYRDHLCVASRLYDGVAATLTALRARNLPLAVVTNKNEALARRLLADLHIAEYFALIYGGDTLPEKNPHRCRFLPLPKHSALLRRICSWSVIPPTTSSPPKRQAAPSPLLPSATPTSAACTTTQQPAPITLLTSSRNCWSSSSSKTVQRPAKDRI